MSLDVPTQLLTAAEHGEVDDAQFVAVVGDSLPYAWHAIGAAVDDLANRPVRVEGVRRTSLTRLRLVRQCWPRRAPRGETA